MTLQVVRRIAEERENSQIVLSKPRTEVQRVRLHGLYELLVVLRIILTLNLQTGWIHQDELSNSIEVIAGDYFDLQVFKPGGFNSSFPTHSIVILHATLYLPYILCNSFLSYEHPVGKETTPNSKMLLLIPRIVYLVISFLVDYILVKFCILNDPTKMVRKNQENGDVPQNPGPGNTTNDGRTQNNTKTNPPSNTTSDKPPENPQRRTRKQVIISSSSSENEEKVERPRRRRKPRKVPKVQEVVQPRPQPQPEPHPQPDPPVSDNPYSNDYTIRLVTLASSQVLLIFATRTHPSAINLLLFSLLLYLVSASFHAYDEYIPLLEAYHRIPKTDGVGKVHFLKKMKATGYSAINRLHLITLITVIGIFNDPEFFVSYASIPLFFYMQRGISHRHFGMKYFHARIFTFIAYFFLFSFPLVMWDSFYYGKITFQDLKELNISPESFVVAPANYFARKESQFRDIWGYLKILGLYLVVFNILGVMGIISFVKELYDMMFAEWRHKPNLDSHWTFLNCSLFLPLFFLIQAHGNSYSVFDLSPLIFPLVYMHGHKIPLVSRFSGRIGFLWFASNCVGVLYFGYMSQGGILTSFMDLYDNLTPIRFNNTQVDVTFSQMTAIPPTFTLVIPSKWKTILETPNSKVTPSPSLDDTFKFTTFNTNPDQGDDDLPPSLHKTVLKLEQTSKVRVYHTGYSPLAMSHLERDLHRLVHKQDVMGKEEGDKISFLLIPYIYGRESEETFRMLKLTHIKTYWNHVYFDFLPDIADALSLSWDEFISWKNIRKLWNNKNWVHFGLSLYRMEKVPYGSEKPMADGSNKTKTKMEETFMRYFQFHDAFCDFLKYIVNSATILLTSGLFLTSYLVYLT